MNTFNNQINRLAVKALGLMVIGDSKTITTDNGMTFSLEL